MNPLAGRWRRAPRIALILMIPMAVPGLARAGDITAFVALPAPTDTWGRGYGATISSTWFQAVSLEGEAARVPGDRTDAAMTSFTAAALLAPPIGKLTPYGGVGVGVFRQTLGTESDTGTLKAFILGAKVQFGLVVLKGEYRRITLSGTPLLNMTARISAGAGIAF
ncbi:MAG TPA: hypothetical protein VFT38_11280 [Vicinamibacteria bacterium]|nr:hypothetical protein [Vicinamibacteria bacterium]